MAAWKSKEDFILCMKTACNDRKGPHHFELYHRLLKLFVEADVKKIGMVSKENFSILVDAAASIPRQFGYAPPDSEIYKSEEHKVKARSRMFDVMDIKNTGVISFDGWYKFFMDHITAKVTPIVPHTVLNKGNKKDYTNFIKKAVVPRTEEHDDLYWFLLEMFMAHDMESGADGNVNKQYFFAMVTKLLEHPMRVGLKCPALDPEELFKKYAARPTQMSFDEWLDVAIEGVYKKF